MNNTGNRLDLNMNNTGNRLDMDGSRTPVTRGKAKKNSINAYLIIIIMLSLLSAFLVQHSMNLNKQLQQQTTKTNDFAYELLTLLISKHTNDISGNDNNVHSGSGDINIQNMIDEIANENTRKILLDAINSGNLSGLKAAISKANGQVKHTVDKAVHQVGNVANKAGKQLEKEVKRFFKRF